MKTYIVYHSVVLSRKIEAENGDEAIRIGDDLLKKTLQGVKTSFEEVDLRIRDEIRTTYDLVEK